MAYVRPARSEQVGPETIRMLGRLAGLEIPPEDLDRLAEAFGGQLASIALLDQLDLTGINPAVEFDPRWPAAGAS